MDIERKIPAWAEGFTLFNYLERWIIRESKTCLRRLIAGGRIKINGHAVSSSRLLRRNEVVSFPETIRRGAPQTDVPDIGVSVLYEDDDHLVVDKPHGVPVVSGRKRTVMDLSGWLLGKLNRNVPAGGPYIRPHFVHRLDRETSGVLLVAKNPEAAACLAMQFQNRRVKKQYIGIVEGYFPRDSYRAVIPLKRSSNSAIAMIPAEDRGKEAITDIEVIQRYRDFTLLRMCPLTGRQHQLRVHLQALGYPLAVDFLYGNRERMTERDFGSITGKENELKGVCDELVIDRTPLHAESLIYRLPSGDRMKEQRAPLPEDMTSFLERLRIHDSL